VFLYFFFFNRKSRRAVASHLESLGSWDRPFSPALLGVGLLHSLKCFLLQTFQHHLLQSYRSAVKYVTSNFFSVYSHKLSHFIIQWKLC